MGGRIEGKLVGRDGYNIRELVGDRDILEIEVYWRQRYIGDNHNLIHPSVILPHQYIYRYSKYKVCYY